jgi:formiminotetrahydrofolate cyclodeaminase
MLADRTVRDLLDAFAAPVPTPGGGSAAALAGAVAAALLAMVAAMPKTRAGTTEDRTALDRALGDVQPLRHALTDLVDRDAASYDAVVAAYRLPKGTDEEKTARKRAVAEAMKGATDVPLETARAAASVVAIGRVVLAHGNPNAASDAGVAIELARAARSGARMNGEINLGDAADAAAATIRDELARLTTASA